MRPSLVLAALALVASAGCGDTARLTVADGTGPNPVLPEPSTSLIPTVNIAPATGWAEGARPRVAPGYTITRYAEGFDHPRWLYVLPNGDVLVAESNAPPEAGTGGLIGTIRAQVQKRAGSGGASADRITLLRDETGDGVADASAPFLTGLASPFGMALVGSDLYVANSGSLVRYPYRSGDTQITAPPDTVLRLPAGEYNQHWTRNVIADPDGTRLYVAIGSASNVGEHGLDEEAGRAAIWEVDLQSGGSRVFASGLRNPVGMAWEPAAETLWTVVNERDELGSDLVPDYLTSVQDGGFYGWPYSYFGSIVDTRVEPRRPDLVARAIVPDYALGPHTASLGLTWSDGGALAALGPGMVVGQHGSWNRKPKSGYKVVFVPFREGQPAGDPVDLVTGFLDDRDNAQGRPVGVAVDATGALLVADDVGNIVWRVTRDAP